MKQFLVKSKGVDVGLFTPTAEFDSPKNSNHVFGRFSPFEPYREIASLFQFSDERHGSDWDNSPETVAKRTEVDLRLYSVEGELIPTESITIYDCIAIGIACELHAKLLMRQHVGVLLSEN